VILEVGGHRVSTPADVTADLAQANKEGCKAALIKLHTADGNRFWAAKLSKSG
jgi:hypothetical protein